MELRHPEGPQPLSSPTSRTWEPIGDRLRPTIADHPHHSGSWSTHPQEATVTGSVKMALAVAVMAVGLAGCGGGNSELASSDSSLSPPPIDSTSVPADATSATDPPVPPTAEPPAPAPRSAPPATRPVTPSSGPGAPAPDHPATGRSCEDSLERVDGLGALGTDCETAHRVADAYDTKVMGAGNFPDNASLAVADGWSCGSRVSDESEESFYVTCDRGDSRIEAVTFTWGV